MKPHAETAPFTHKERFVKASASIRPDWFSLSQFEKLQQMDAGDVGDSFLTVAEVAATLKLNQQTVRNWIDQGSLPALRVGRRVRIRRSDFQRLLDQGYMSASGQGRAD